MEQIKLFFFYNFLIIFWFGITKVDCIIGGHNAPIGNFPYMVSVRADNQHICGGTIIGEKHVITAAHCVIDSENQFKNKVFSIRGGTVNLNTANSFEVTRDVVKIYIPVEYERIKNIIPLVEFLPEVGDLAVLQLDAPLILNTMTLDKAQLPARKRGKAFIKFYNELVNVTGFGSDIINRGIQNDRSNSVIVRKNEFTLNYIRSKIIHKSTCKSMILIPLSDNHMCVQVLQPTEESVRGVCNGDSGGPVVIENMIVGVLAQNRYDCNEYFGASLYTRVSSYVPFINRILGEKDLIDTRVAQFQRIDTGNELERSGKWIEVK